jgi:hypothetical protein
MAELEAKRAPSRLPMPPTGAMNQAAKHNLVIREGRRGTVVQRGAVGGGHAVGRAIKGGAAPTVSGLPARAQLTRQRALERRAGHVELSRGDPSMPDSASGVGRFEKQRRREPGPLASPHLGDARWLPESAPTGGTTDERAPHRTGPRPRAAPFKVTRWL